MRTNYTMIREGKEGNVQIKTALFVEISLGKEGDKNHRLNYSRTRKMFYNLRELDGVSFSKQTQSSTMNHELACHTSHIFFKRNFN